MARDSEATGDEEDEDDEDENDGHVGERTAGDKGKQSARGAARGASALLGRVFFMKGFERRARRARRRKGERERAICSSGLSLNHEKASSPKVKT